MQRLELIDHMRTWLQPHLPHLRTGRPPKDHQTIVNALFDWSAHIIVGTFVRAHRHAAGAQESSTAKRLPVRAAD